MCILKSSGFQTQIKLLLFTVEKYHRNGETGRKTDGAGKMTKEGNEEQIVLMNK